MEMLENIYKSSEANESQGIRYLRFFEEKFTQLLTLLTAFLLLSMSIIIVYSVVARYFFDAPSGYAEELLRYSLVWLGLIGAALCFLGDRHLSLPIIFDKCSDRAKRWLTMANSVLVIYFGILLCAGGYEAIIKNQGLITPMLKVSVGTLQTATFISGAFIIFNRLLYIVRSLGVNRKTAFEFIVSASVLFVLHHLFIHLLDNDSFQNLVADNTELVSTITLFTVFFAY